MIQDEHDARKQAIEDQMISDAQDRALKPVGIPPNYVQNADGVWSHPSRVHQNSPSARAMALRNPHEQPQSTETPKRIRQSSKPLMNKLEQEYFDKLRIATPEAQLFAQSITFKLANGVRYTPDIFCFAWPWKSEARIVAWEVKGAWMTDDAVVKLKVFAAAYPNIVVLLASKDKEAGLWFNQEVWG